LYACLAGVDGWVASYLVMVCAYRQEAPYLKHKATSNVFLTGIRMIHEVIGSISKFSQRVLFRITTEIKRCLSFGFGSGISCCKF
jgi:hypothetical protein